MITASVQVRLIYPAICSSVKLSPRDWRIHQIALVKARVHMKSGVMAVLKIMSGRKKSTQIATALNINMI